MPKSKEVLEEHVDMSKGHKSQLEMVPSGQIWNNLSVKVENDNNGL